MQEYNKKPLSFISRNEVSIPSFLDPESKENIDWQTVDSFGSEWEKFNSFDEEEIKLMGDQYFDITQNIVKKDFEVLDMGCGSGRWSKYLCEKVNFIEAIDPSFAVFQANAMLRDKPNVRVSHASVDSIPFKDNSFDLVFSLGVLHHIPDTNEAIKKCIAKVKPGGYFLVYLYYNLDNRNIFFKLLFSLSNLFRMVISKLPQSIKTFICDVLAVIFYLPFVALSRILLFLGFSEKTIKHIPLSYYHNKSFKVIRNDSLDRFGTPLEQRFSKKQIHLMLENAGLKEIVFSDNEPYWHAIGKKY